MRSLADELFELDKFLFSKLNLLTCKNRPNQSSMKPSVGCSNQSTMVPDSTLSKRIGVKVRSGRICLTCSISMIQPSSLTQFSSLKTSGFRVRSKWTSPSCLTDLIFRKLRMNLCWLMVMPGSTTFTIQSSSSMSLTLHKFVSWKTTCLFTESLL